MTTMIPTKRQPSGVPTGGQFAPHDRNDDAIGLNWPETPTDDQVSRGKEEARRRVLVGAVSSNGGSFDEAAKQIAQDIAEQEASYNAWRRGTSHPDDVEFADIWDGRTPGMSREQVEIRLSEIDAQESATLVADKAALRKLSPFTEDRQEILALIGMERRHLMDSLACAGRNLSINQAVILRLKQESVPF
jgi:hypothetical protein